MEKYLSKFTNLSDYINFRNTDIPEINVSYVESMDRVIYYSGDKANKNFYFKVLNPENISQWDTDSNGREYININPLGEKYIRVYYLTDGERRGTDDDGIVFKLYKDSDYTITILWQEAGGNPGVKGIGRDNGSNTFGLKYKVGGNINSWFRMSNEDLSSFVLPSDWDYTQYTNLFNGNKYVLDFTDLYIPVGENYKYTNMFSGFDIDPNDTLLMTDFYFNNPIQDRGSAGASQYTYMFCNIPVSNFAVYITGKTLLYNHINNMFSGATFTTVPNLVIETTFGGELRFESFFESCSNLTNIWIPTMNKQLDGVTYNFTKMYKNCDALTDLSSYMIDFTDNENIAHNFMLDEMFKSDNGGSLTKGIKVKLNVWNNAFSMSDMYYNQSNLSEIYLLGDNVGTYNGDSDSGKFLNTAGNFPSSGTVYVTDTNITINELNSKFGIPLTWTASIYTD